ncbi:MAG: hypothetical protein ACHQJ4_04250 [Ignavibacteria bacterium]
MLRVSALIYLFLFLVCIDVSGQDKVKTNLDVFDEIITSGFEKIIYSPEINRNGKFVFIIKTGDKYTGNDETEIKRYIRSVIKKLAGNEKLNIAFTDEMPDIRKDSVYYLLNIRVNLLQTGYNGFLKNKFLGEKIIARELKVDIPVNVASADSLVNMTEEISKDYKDGVNLDDFEGIESDQYRFTRSQPPEIGIFESTVFPALLIAASGGATLLFFIIRTK